MEKIKGMQEFLEVYIENSTITEIIYKVDEKIWLLKFKDKSKLGFNSFAEMCDWLHADQFGD